MLMVEKSVTRIIRTFLNICVITRAFSYSVSPVDNAEGWKEIKEWDLRNIKFDSFIPLLPYVCFTIPVNH